MLFLPHDTDSSIHFVLIQSGVLGNNYPKIYYFTKIGNKSISTKINISKFTLDFYKKFVLYSKSLMLLPFLSISITDR
jgi:hypothetical protein